MKASKYSILYRRNQSYLPCCVDLVVGVVDDILGEGLQERIVLGARYRQQSEEDAHTQHD